MSAEQHYHIRSAPAESPQCAFLFARCDSLRQHVNTGLYMGISSRDAAGGLLTKCTGPFGMFRVDEDRMHIDVLRSSGAIEPHYVLLASVLAGKQDKDALNALFQDVNRGMKHISDWTISIEPAAFSQVKEYKFGDFAEAAHKEAQLYCEY